MATDTGLHEVVDEVVDGSAVASQHVAQKVPVPDHKFANADFAKARINKKDSRVPQVIAHRGYKAKYPDNSMLAFREAVKAGASALETDAQLTKDGTVLLSHDGDLKRFGDQKKKLVDCTWEEVKQMKTLVEPNVHMIRLSDLLEFLLEPDNSETWLLLDVKTDNDAGDLVRQIASTLASAQAFPDKPWNKRVVLGLWTARHQAFAAEFLPDFAAVHNGFNLPHARRKLKNPSIGTNTVVQSLIGPGGRRFMRDYAGRAGPSIAWTVNDRDKAEWCARRGLDGVLTDDPQAIVPVLEAFDARVREPWMPFSLRACLDTAFLLILINGFFWYFRRALKLEP